MNDNFPILEMKNINKYFPGVKALSNVDFRLFKGEVHAIMGQNGAGKSTLIKVLTGVHPQETGEILLDGKIIKPNSPLEAQKLGISTVYQEVNLCPNLSVAENIFIGRQPVKFGKIDWKKMNNKSAELLKKMNLDIDVTKLLSSYSVAVQQLVAIVRVLDISAKVLILDEPTSSLDENEVEALFNVIRKLRDEGLAIIFITHFLDQTYNISDRITILKNGTLIGEYKTKELPKIELVAKMLGKELSDFSYSNKEIQSANSEKKVGSINLINIKKMGKKNSIKPFDLEINEGEILGLAGLLGSGRTEMARLIFGIDKPDRGDIFIKDKKTAINTPENAIDSGMGFCPEDRKNEGIIADLSIRENIILALQGKKGIFRSIPMKKQVELVDKLIKMLGIVTTGPEQELKKLSGGNQQKVLLAKWLATDPKLLILDEPTRGIDVGAKLEIMELVLKLSRSGLSVIFISSEIEEVIRCSDRITVMKDKTKVAELKEDEIDEQSIMRSIAGGKTNE